MSDVELGRNGRPKGEGNGGPPTKERRRYNRLVDASAKCSDIHLDMLEQYNEKVMDAYRITLDFPLGKCDKEVTVAHYKAAKDLVDNWRSACARAEEQLDFLNGLDPHGKVEGEQGKAVPSNVAQFSKVAKKD